jgi:hypothetical protein
MSSGEKIFNENRNWYIVEIIEKYEPVHRNEENELRRVTTWGNHHLIKADTPEQAYDKAMILGKKSNYKFINSDKIEMESLFVGIGDLLPIYEDIEDGAELMWTNYGFISNKRTMKIPFTKEELLKNIKPDKNDLSRD